MGRIEILYTNIGRGHPFYLDGIIHRLEAWGRGTAAVNSTDVFKVSSGTSLLAWRLARWLYLKGSSPGLIGSVYRRLRAGSDYNRSSLFLNILSSGLRSVYRESIGTVVVAHPILVAALRGHEGLVYQHGEVIVPTEALVGGASKVLVPTREAASLFLKSGYRADQLFVSGLCVEPDLVAQASASFDTRLKRLQSDHHLTGAFFSSGAEPAHHVERLTTEVSAAVATGSRAIVFARKGGLLERRVCAALRRASMSTKVIDSLLHLPTVLPQVTILTHTDRASLDKFTAELFPQFDYFVSPSHERTNWALGLGLPMFIVGPSVGPFAPLNSDLLREHGVAIELSAGDKAALLDRIELVHMSTRGWGRYRIDGFEMIARFLVNKLPQTS